MIKLKIRYYLVILFYISLYSIKAQEQQSDAVKIGGTYRHYNANIEPRVLDKATLSVIYKFKHQVINDKKIYFLIDTMQLVSGSKVSIYYDRNNLKRRKAFSNYLEKGDLPKAWISVSYPEFSEAVLYDNNYYAPHRTGDTYELYKNRSKHTITVMDFDNSNFEDHLFFYYEEQMSPIDWEIYEDTTSLLGYECTKATCSFGGRSYTAWFTQDIPINDGPYKFYGLPGMIMKLEDSESIFQFTAIGIARMDNAEIIIQDNSKYEKMNKSEYFEIKKRMQQNNTLFYRSGALLLFSNKKDGIVYTPIEISKQ